MTFYKANNLVYINIQYIVKSLIFYFKHAIKLWYTYKTKILKLYSFTAKYIKKIHAASVAFIQTYSLNFCAEVS